ncbi:DNA mismatch repair protein MutL [Chondrocystis sp. NIES-4102]|nr:DNA mismatch repair protein MutL [Chondrocystis sp. NIES-4102]
MASQIKILPNEVIDLIAAGEVIDSLAAVVRELVENSLDAAASRITIALDPQIWQIQVIDNGEGMSLEDLRICAQPHSTSKINNCKDLWRITSLGFRGEALHSIAQVADLTISSRSKQQIEPVGWKITYQEGKAQNETAIAIAPGTIVTVSNLFAKIPVRRRGLPPVEKQLKTIQKLIYQIALCHPQVTWQVKQHNNIWFNISPGSTPKDVLPQLLKRITSNDLHYLQVDIPTPTPSESQPLWGATQKKSQIELTLGLPDRCHRHCADWVKVSVNNRQVRSPELEQTVLNSMAKTLPRDRFPVCLLHLHTCPSQIDWNRHPAKTEIYLHSLPYWQTEVSKAISQALTFNLNNLPVEVGDQRLGKILKVAEASGKYEINRNLAQTLQETTTSPISGINSLKLKAVAQVNKTYIVAEHSSGLWLVEQHIAHERVLYEQLQAFWELTPLPTPITLEYLKPTQIEQLQRLGIDIELFGANIWAVRNAPKILASRDDCAEALIELSWGGDLRSAQVATACRSAIRNGTTLTLEAMQNLLDLWQNTRNPRTCPHGRPIYLALEESTLARFFRRHWVIGKSHGILSSEQAR